MTQAEAGKRAAILEAEGVKESAVLRAQGMAEARLAMAQAEAETIGRIAAALPEGEALEAAAYLLALRYFEALPAVAQGSATTLFLPAEASGVLGALGSLRSLLKESTAANGSRPVASRIPHDRIKGPKVDQRLLAGPPADRGDWIWLRSLERRGRRLTQSPRPITRDRRSGSRARTPVKTAGNTATSV